MYHCWQFRREEFLRHYHKHSNVESTFAMIKAKLRDHVRSKTNEQRDDPEAAGLVSLNWNRVRERSGKLNSALRAFHR